MGINPLLIKSVPVASNQPPSRYPSPKSSSDEESSSEYLPFPTIMPSRSGPSVTKRQTGVISSRSATPLIDVEEYSPSQCSSPSVFVRKSKNQVKRKKGGGGRKGEPRREQNMAAQKKYRDKRVNTAHLVRKLESIQFTD
jgi:hypothetical protein